jgi:hypothetical protein
MSYHRVCNNSNKTGATHGAGTAYLFGVHPQFLWGSCCSIANFLCRGLWIIVCPCVLFRLKFNLSVLRFMASCYPLALLSSCYPLDIFLFPLDIFLLPPWYLLVTPLISSCYPLDIFLLSLDIFKLKLDRIDRYYVFRMSLLMLRWVYMYKQLIIPKYNV